MNEIIINGDGTISESGRRVREDTLSILGHAVRLGDGFTLRSYFRLYENFSVFVGLSALAPSFLEEYRKRPESGCIWDGADYLEFSKTVEMIGFPGKPRLEIYNSLRGKSGSTEVEIRTVPLEQLLDMPLSLGKLKHIVFGDRVDVLTFETVYTLFEFLDGIVWELSFQGTLLACELRR